MKKDKETFTCRASDGTYVLSTGNKYRIIAGGEKTDNRYSLMEAILEPGQGAPYHIHTREDEAFFILEGEVTFYLKDEKINAKKEDFVSCAPHEIRGFRNNTNKVSRMLLFYSSAGIEEMTLKNGTIIDENYNVTNMKNDYSAQCPILSEEYGVKEINTEMPNS